LLSICKRTLGIDNHSSYCAPRSVSQDVSDHRHNSYLVHSSFAIIFPCHLLYLTLTTKYSTAALCNGLTIALANHLTPNLSRAPTTFPRFQFLRLILALTFGLTYPGLLWFIAISLAP
jgi:hypothetical protein